MPINSKTVNRLLWTAQVLLAVLFLVAGVMKLVMPIEKMQGPVSLPLSFIRFIGVAETVGALGLILPGLLNIRTELTALAASGLVIIMIGASAVTIIWIGIAGALFPFIVGLVSATVAYRRWQVLPRRTPSRKPVLHTL
jgi:hypothetical protein